jgi:hypothetical protein
VAERSGTGQPAQDLPDSILINIRLREPAIHSADGALLCPTAGDLDWITMKVVPTGTCTCNLTGPGRNDPEQTICRECASSWSEDWLVDWDGTDMVQLVFMLHRDW